MRLWVRIGLYGSGALVAIGLVYFGRDWSGMKLFVVGLVVGIVWTLIITPILILEQTRAKP